jgi:hypothetical protein
MYVEVRLITNQIRLLHSVELESEKCRVVRLVVGQHHEHVQPSSKSEVNLCKVTKLKCHSRESFPLLQTTTESNITITINYWDSNYDYNLNHNKWRQLWCCFWCKDEHILNPD